MNSDQFDRFRPDCFLSVSLRTQIKQHEFREQFRTEPIFSINNDEPYKLIDKVFPYSVCVCVCEYTGHGFLNIFTFSDMDNPLSTDVFYELNPTVNILGSLFKCVQRYYD